MSLRPTGHKILVKPLAVAEQTRGGILLSSAYQQPSGSGVVLGVGGKVTDEALKPGARVFYSWIDTLEINHGGENLRLLDARQILGVEA